LTVEEVNFVNEYCVTLLIILVAINVLGVL
jgi:hypothetical protein